MTRAFVYQSGLIDFGTSVPAGATVIARGCEPALSNFIKAKALRGRDFRVPGVGQAENAIAREAALKHFCAWIGQNPPRGVRVLPR